MDKHLEKVYEKRIEMIIGNLKARRMNGYCVKDIQELNVLLDELVRDKTTVSVGGSMTLFETGVIDYLRQRDVNFLDRYAEGLSKEDITKMYKEVFFADCYLASTNAITEKGELYNVDGTGNRVAAMVYGPEKVILIVGMNKIVRDIPEAIERNRKIAAPANVQRLNRNTPCLKTGYCTDCISPERVCHTMNIIQGQANSERMHIIFIMNEYGY